MGQLEQPAHTGIIQDHTNQNVAQNSRIENSTTAFIANCGNEKSIL